MRKKIAILTNIIPPYRLPLFNGVGEKVRLDILICADKEKNRQWDSSSDYKFRVKRLRGLTLTLRNSLNDYRFIYLKVSILFYLLLSRPQKLIIGDASLTSYLAAVCCKILGVNYIWWNETLPFTPIKQGILGALRVWCIRNAEHHFVSGTLAKKFITNYGVEDQLITIIPDAVNNDEYFSYHAQLKLQSEVIRHKYGINESDFIILYVGQFIKRKNIQLMLEAYKEVYLEDKNVKFIMVGGGELTEAILQFKEIHKLDGLIVLGFMKTEQLAELYTIAKVLLLISKSEPWGMVVNEAMCFGIPVIASEYVGAAVDLVDENTGVIIGNIDDPRGVVSALEFSMRYCWDKNLIKEKVRLLNNQSAIEGVLYHVI